LDNVFEPEGVAYRDDKDQIYLLTKANRVLVFVDADDGLEPANDDDRGSITPTQSSAWLRPMLAMVLLLASDASDQPLFSRRRHVCVATHAHRDRSGHQ
jgi:hypothetical protein